MVNVSQYFDVKEKRIRQIFFKFNKINNIGVQILIEDEKRVCSRTVKDNLLSYTGPAIDHHNLGNPTLKKFMIQFSQNRYSKKDKSKKCEVYPTDMFSTYNDCDENFILNTMRKYYKFIPVWATNDIKNVTKYAIYEEEDGISRPVNYDDLYDGTKVSPCTLPCTSTQISGAYISAREVSTNHTTFDLTFAQIVTIVNSDFPKFDWTKFFSDLGGSMGLWLGLGMVQFFGAIFAFGFKFCSTRY